ncbi:MAG TPA: DUF1772 domain-containing protein [Clostridia bacterium]|nr:DUF1772 domain-containing protein [Clostridia bacterium]
MTVSDLFHALTIITTGLFSGLMMTLVVILQKQWSSMNRSEYYSNFQGFLKVAKGNAFVTVLTLFSFLVPLLLGILAAVENKRALGLSLILAGVLCLIGCFIVTIKLNFPIYNKVVSWTSENDAADWEDTRRRFYFLNIIRFSSSTLSFIILVFSKIYFD